MTASLEDWLNRVYLSGGDTEALEQAYNDWAKEYDQQLWASGTPYFIVITGLVGRHVPDLSSRILDAGCGTGMMAEPLHLIGYHNLCGLDASGGMLEVARRKGCYAELFQLFLGRKIDLPDNSFDAIIAGGVLTQGHAPAESLDGMLAIAKPGAPIIFSISSVAHDQGGFGARMQALTDSGAWTLVEKSKPFPTFPFSDEYSELRNWVCVYRKTG